MPATVYLGTSDFAATVLERLARSPHRPVLVITRPDARQGRGRQLHPPPVALAARALGIPLLQPADVNTPEVLEAIARSGASLVVVCAFGAIVREPLLSALEILNVHPSLLPRWRGAAPIERAIMANDESTGVAIMRLAAGLDSGPVCAVRELAIGKDEDYGGLSARLAQAGGELLVGAIDSSPPFREQPETGVTYAEKLGAADRRLDPVAEDARSLHARVRALSPHIGAVLELADGERLGVWSSVITDVPGCGLGNVDLGAGHARVSCREGVLELLRVQPAGKRAMDVGDWLRGRRG